MVLHQFIGLPEFSGYFEEKMSGEEGIFCRMIITPIGTKI
jgi:hypothetical protein